MALRLTGTLSRTAWLNALEELALACADSDGGDVRGHVTEINALLLIGEGISPIVGVRPIDPQKLSTLLNADAFESAVMAMLHHGGGYLVSRSGDGQSLATVSLPGSGLEHSGAGATPALALIGALAMSLSTVALSRPPATRRVAVGTGVALH